MNASDILAALQRLRVPHEEIAGAIGRDRSAATRMLRGARKMRADEIPALTDLVTRYEAAPGAPAQQPSASPSVVRETGPTGAGVVLLRDYVPIEVLPTDPASEGADLGDRATMLLPRRLVEDELHAQPYDLRLMQVRGDSMAPLFRHGDHLLIDTRDRNPVQPGPFALRIGGGYVLKNLERLSSSGRLRLFSTDPQYTPEQADLEDVTIIGRPVWYARRL
jgi:phage repressor protein C with HTH and peptisase S24 domain